MVHCCIRFLKVIWFIWLFLIVPYLDSTNWNSSFLHFVLNLAKRKACILFWNFCGRQFWCSSNINTRVKPVVFTVHGCATDVNHVCGTSFHRDSGDPDGFPAIANDGLWPQLQLHVLQHQSWWGGWRSVQPLPDPPRWWWCGWRAGGEGQSSYRVYYVKVRSLCLLWRKGVLYQTY